MVPKSGRGHAREYIPAWDSHAKPPRGHTPKVSKKKEDAREETQLSVKHWFQQEIELFVVFFPVTYTHSCVSSCTDSPGFTDVIHLCLLLHRLSCVSFAHSLVSCCTDSLLYIIARLSCVYCCTDPRVCFLLHIRGVPYCTDSCADPVSSVASLPL